MSSLTLKQRFFIIASIFIFLTALIIILLIRQSPTPPTITSHSYQPTTPTQSESIILFFEIPIVSQNFQITSSPTESWTITNFSTNQLSITAQQPLLSKTEYTIDFTWQNQSLPPYTLTTPLSNVDYRNNYLIQQELDLDYPLAKSTPYETNYLRVVYISPMTLEITLKTTSITEQEAISQVKSWVTKNSGDSSAHEYQVTPQESSPSP